MNERHRGPHDRGSADAWYERPFDPHYFVGDTYNSEKVPWHKMTKQEIKEYTIGYESVANSGLRKEWF